MARKKTRKKNNPRFLKWLGGSTTISFLVLVVIVGSVLLVGGLFPKTQENNLSTPEEVVLDPSSIPSGGKNSLQLKTVKFKKCSGETTVDLLLDRSSSMSLRTPSGETKLQRLKEAVLALTNKLSDTSIIGIQSFSSDSITDDLPISYYKDAKSQIPGALSGIIASGNTPTYNALAYSLERLKEALPKFPDKKFNFIFISDGAPCPGFGCSTPGEDQDPRKYNPNPADEIKKLGINVYTLGIYDSVDSLNPQLADLLKSIATSPENYYEAQTGDQAKKLLEAISIKICNQAN